MRGIRCVCAERWANLQNVSAHRDAFTCIVRVCPDLYPVVYFHACLDAWAYLGCCLFVHEPSVHVKPCKPTHLLLFVGLYMYACLHPSFFLCGQRESFVRCLCVVFLLLLNDAIWLWLTLTHTPWGSYPC